MFKKIKDRITVEFYRPGICRENPKLNDNWAGCAFTWFGYLFVISLWVVPCVWALCLN